MNEIFQQFVNWLPQFSNTPAGFRIGINASHIWALVYPVVGVLSLFAVKRTVSKFFSWRKQKFERKVQDEKDAKLAEVRADQLSQERADKEAQKQLPGPWFHLYQRLKVAKSVSTSRILIESFLEHFDSLPVITPEGYKLILRSASFVFGQKDETDHERNVAETTFLTSKIGKYIRYQIGTEPAVVKTRSVIEFPRSEVRIDFPGSEIITRAPFAGSADWPAAWCKLRDNLISVNHLTIPDVDKDEHRRNIIRQFADQHRKELEICPLPWLNVKPISVF